MNKRIAALLGGVAAVVAFNAGQAAAASVAAGHTGSLNAQSYAELLEPIPNAVPLLMADDAERAQRPAQVQLAQYHHHHHHHHHHRQFGGFGFGGIVVRPPVYAEPNYYGGDCYIRRQVVINQWGQRVVRRIRVCD